MAISDTEIRWIQSSSSYLPYPHGSKSGEPTVKLKLSKSENNGMKVGSVERLFENFGWRKKLASGFARLRITGFNPLGEIHREPIENLYTILNPTFVDMEIDEKDLQREPSRDIQNLTDFFSIFLTTDKEYDEDTFEHFAKQSRNYGNVEFIVKVDKHSDEDIIKEISRNYNIYDSDIWIYPAGRKFDSVAENMEKCEKMAKRNTWNVSPRLDLMEPVEDDEDE